MKLQLSSLRSRFAWRVFVLFLLAALIPILVAGLLAFTQVTNLLTEQAQKQLRHTGKAYGLALIVRLQETARALQGLQLDDGRPADLDQTRIRDLYDKIDSLSWVDAGGKVDLLFGRPPVIDRQALSQARPERPAIHAAPKGAGAARVSLILAHAAPRATHAYLVAELAPMHLWGDRDALPYGVSVSVRDHEGAEIYNSLDLDKDYVSPGAANRHLTADDTTAEDDPPTEDSLLTNNWELFLNSHFNAHSWMIVTRQPAAQALAPIATFRTLFPGVVLLTLLAVILLSVRQIRRQLVPLEKIISATRRISNKEFDHPVTVDSNDEFQELAQALNAMATRLGRQFGFLTILSDIDRSILATDDIDGVLEMAIRRIHEMIPCDGACITLFDAAQGATPDTYIGKRYCSITDSVERVSIAAREVRNLAAATPVLTVDVARDDNHLAERLRGHGIKTAYLFPVLIEQQVRGFILLGYKDGLCDAEDQQRARDLADRFAVALAAAAHQEQLYLQAHFDPLTGLPNRHLLSDRLGQEIAHAKRDGRRLALLFLDLDRFKNVNDTSGHAAGDELLRQAALRLGGIIHPSNTIARLGGDEFTVVLSGIHGPDDAQATAEDIITALSEPFVIAGGDHFVSASIGITLYPGGGDTAAELLKNADMAMYRAKDGGRGQYRFYDEAMNQTAIEKNLLERDLRHAVARDEFVLHYQPQVDIRNGSVVSAEALIRWQHPQRGLVSPLKFIPLAEETGYVDVMGEWVLRSACRQLRDWQAMGIHLSHLAVNVASRQFAQEHFVATVRTILEETGIEPALLELEITEGTLMEDHGNAIRILEQLRTMGVKLSIDDFGTGYSSLAYLKRFPIDSLKIDRAFIRDLPGDEDARAITASIIALAKTMQKEVIAEGVETPEQIAFLAQHQCHTVQGYYYSPALSADQFATFVQTLHTPAQPARSRG